MEQNIKSNYDRRTAKIARYWPLVEKGKRGSPVSLQVAMTDSCFNRCIGCGHPFRPQRRMGVGRWLNFVSGLQPLVESVCYSGGDPFAEPEFNRVMQWHIDEGVDFGCTVTGFVPHYVDFVLLSAAKWVRVSLDAVDPDVYEKVRGKTPLDKVLLGIDSMLRHGVNVELGVTLHPANEGQLPKLYDFAKGKGIKQVHTRYAYPNSNALWKDVGLADRGVLKFEHCNAVFYQLYIDSDGSVFPCCITAGDTRKETQSKTLGNIFTDAWPAIWAQAVSYSKLTLNELPPICKTCCVKRLSEINHACDNMPSGKSFF